MIKRIDNFLSENIIVNIKKIVEDNLDSTNWKTSMFWQEQIKKSSAVLPLFNLDNFSEIKELILDFYKPYLNFKNFKNFHLTYKIASTIYLNKNWDRDHGGLFMCKNGEDYLAITPKYNHCIINTNDEIHGTTLTTTDAPKRETLQIFFS